VAAENEEAVRRCVSEADEISLYIGRNQENCCIFATKTKVVAPSQIALNV